MNMDQEFEITGLMNYFLKMEILQSFD